MARTKDAGEKPYVYMAGASGVNYDNVPLGAPKVSYENRKTSSEQRAWLWGHQQAVDSKDLELKRQTEGI